MERVPIEKAASEVSIASVEGLEIICLSTQKPGRKEQKGFKEHHVVFYTSRNAGVNA